MAGRNLSGYLYIYEVLRQLRETKYVFLLAN